MIGMRVALERGNISIQAPEKPIISSVNTGIVDTPEEVRSALVDGIPRPVMWDSLISRLRNEEGVGRMIVSYRLALLLLPRSLTALTVPRTRQGAGEYGEKGSGAWSLGKGQDGHRDWFGRDARGPRESQGHARLSPLLCLYTITVTVLYSNMSSYPALRWEDEVNLPFDHASRSSCSSPALLLYSLASRSTETL